MKGNLLFMLGIESESCSMCSIRVVAVKQDVGIVFKQTKLLWSLNLKLSLACLKQIVISKGADCLHVHFLGDLIIKGARGLD